MRCMTSFYFNKNQKADEDIPTDDEQLIFADHYVNAELNEGFDIFTEKGAHSLRNKYFIDK